MNGYSLLYEENSFVYSFHFGITYLSGIYCRYGEFSTYIHSPNRASNASLNIYGVADNNDLCLMVCAADIFGKRQLGWVCGPLFCCGKFG